MSDMTDYQRYIATSRYARWIEDEGRRETWDETVDRYCNFMLKQVEENTSISKKDLKEFKAHPLRKLRGFKDYYRIKVKDFRIGFKKTNNRVIFMRILHRKDIYRHFP